MSADFATSDTFSSRQHNFIHSLILCCSNSPQVMTARQDDGVLLLHGKLERKRQDQAQERMRQAAETKKIRFEQMQQAAGAAAVEEHKFQELREGARREASRSQTTTLAEANKVEDSRAKLAAARNNVVKQVCDFVCVCVGERETWRLSHV